MSVIEQTPREDLAGVYGTMDFATRDNYRHAVEKIARNSAFAEGDVAHKAIQLVHASTANALGSDVAGSTARMAHVGYYLIDKGLPQFKRSTNVQMSAIDAVRKKAAGILRPSIWERSRCSPQFSRGRFWHKDYAEVLNGWLLAASGIVAALCAAIWQRARH